MHFKDTSPPAPANATDWSDVTDLQRQLIETVSAMDAMTAQVGHAKQIAEFNGEQRKRVLALAAAPLIAAGQSATAADTEARASHPYAAALKMLAQDLENAETVMAQWRVLSLKWDTARSLLSLQREGMKQL